MINGCSNGNYLWLYVLPFQDSAPLDHRGWIFTYMEKVVRPSGKPFFIWNNRVYVIHPEKKSYTYTPYVLDESGENLVYKGIPEDGH